jgi:mannose-1-phosphate guanylyltransferase
MMRAILLSAGYGTRLRPLTDNTPKCLVPIQDQPLLEIWLQRLSNAKISPFLINTHYLSEQVIKYISGSVYCDKTTIVHESELLGTAGTLLNNIDFYQNNDGMLVHADNYCLANFIEFIEAHKKRPRECLMTIMTFRTETPSSCGIVEVDSRGVVIGFHEKVALPPGNLANGAIYILSAELLKDIQIRYPYATDFSTEIINKYLGKIYTYESREVFIDIGSPESYAMANERRNDI